MECYIVIEWVYTHTYAYTFIHTHTHTHNNKPEIEILHIYMQWIEMTKPVDYAHFQGDWVCACVYEFVCCSRGIWFNIMYNDLAKQKTGE